MSSIVRRAVEHAKVASACLLTGAALAGIACWIDATPPAAPAKADAQAAVAAPPAASVRDLAETVLARPSPGGLASTATAVTPALADDLARHASFTREWLSGHGFAPGSAALDRVHRLLDGRVEPNARDSAALVFGPAAGAAPADGSVKIALAAQERFVQATLPLGAAATGDSVIVRWRSLDDSSVLELSVQAIASNPTDAPEIWMHRTTDWTAGHYRVEVLSADPQLSLLASGDFEIVPDGAPVTPFLVVSSTAAKP
ncbi:MAG TPA: hypothetical protein VGM74_05375 [Burkholderiaceae bacterium]|jgi:hypothetical protein